MEGKRNTKKGRVKFVDEKTAFSKEKEKKEDSASEAEDERSTGNLDKKHVFGILDDIVSFLPSGDAQKKARHFLLALNMDPHVKITENGKIHIGTHEGEHLTAALARLFLPALKTEKEKSNHDYLERLMTYSSDNSNQNSRASADTSSSSRADDAKKSRSRTKREKREREERERKGRKTMITLENKIELSL